MRPRPFVRRFFLALDHAIGMTTLPSALRRFRCWLDHLDIPARIGLHGFLCIVVPVHDVSQKWDPFPPGLHYWPPGVDRSYFVPAFIEAYATIGYKVCADGSLDPSCEKIVLYTNDFGGVEHVARQLSDGRWTSKIGNEEDIIHENPQSLKGGYGEPTVFMQRPLKPKG